MSVNNWSQIIPEEVLYLINRLNSHGYDAWLVGGCVRDMFLGIMPDDYDVATSALPEQVIELFERCLRTGVKHGTVTVILSGNAYEVTTYRSEGPYSDGRRPDMVSYEREIIPDLARRDFTVNSMAWHPDYGLLDPFDGRKHLKARQLRCVGDAKTRLTEDALRQLRAVRFALTYSLHPDSEMLSAIKLHNDKIDKLSAERIQIELTRTGRAAYGNILTEFQGTGLLARVYARSLAVEAEDNLLCRILAGFIQPFWNREQIWTVLILAGYIAQVSESIPVVTDGQYNLDLEYWHKISPMLAAGKLCNLSAMLVERTRLSVTISRHTLASLILIGLRLMIWSADQRAAQSNHDYISSQTSRSLRLQMILRVAARQSHLDQWLTLDACENAWEIMNVLVDDEEFLQELAADKELVFRWRSFPDEFRLSPAQLSLRGNDEVFCNLQDKRRIGIYLERLLSKQLHSNELLSEEQARRYIIAWTSQEI